jgi:hypothetical protein
MSEAIAEGWHSSAVKALQRQFASYVEQTPVQSKAGHASIRGQRSKGHRSHRTNHHHLQPGYRRCI